VPQHGVLWRDFLVAWNFRVMRMDDSRKNVPLWGTLILNGLMPYQSLFEVKICTVKV